VKEERGKKVPHLNGYGRGKKTTSSSFLATTDIGGGKREGYLQRTPSVPSSPPLKEEKKSTEGKSHRVYIGEKGVSPRKKSSSQKRTFANSRKRKNYLYRDQYTRDGP